MWRGFITTGDNFEKSFSESLEHIIMDFESFIVLIYDRN